MDLAEAFAGGRPDAEPADAWLRHLAACTACSAALHAQRRLRPAVKAAFDRADALRAEPAFLTTLVARFRAG